MMAEDAPLAGLRVADFTSMVSGPYCTRLLADMGAHVIKVEPPAGDLLRHAAPTTDAGSRYFQTYNAGKHGIVLDLKSPRGIEIAIEIASRCDVLVENFRPGVMASFGLGYDTIRAHRNNIVYCSISGFGQDGPMQRWPAYAPIVHALSGFDSVFQQAQLNPQEPPVASVQIADVLTGSFAFGAIQSALIRRFRTGAGDYIDATLIESAMALVSGDLQVPQVPRPQRVTSFRAVRARDGFVMPVVLTDKAFASLARIVEPGWLDDPRFKDARTRAQHADLMYAGIDAWTLQRSAQECQETLMSAGVPCAVYATASDVLRNQHLIDRGTFATLNDGCGDFKVNNAPFRFRDAQSGIRDLAPRLGEHTGDVLRDLLGYDDGTVAALRSARVVQ